MATYHFFSEDHGVPFAYLRPTRLVGQVPPPYTTPLTPGAYLEFASADLQASSSRGYVNAFGNIKRAIHLQIDTLLQQYGLFHNHSRASFPTKLQLLDEIGLLPINILRNLNVERNLVEHAYDTPTAGRVAEAMDVARLILLASERLLENTVQEAVVGWRNPKRHVLLRLEAPNSEIRLISFAGRANFRKQNGCTFYAGRVRDFNGKVDEELKIARKPWKTISLDHKNKSTWLPVLRSLVDCQRSRTLQSRFDPENITMTVAVTIPLPALDGRLWSEVLDEFMGKRLPEGDRSSASNEKPRAQLPNSGLQQTPLKPSTLGGAGRRRHGA